MKMHRHHAPVLALASAILIAAGGVALAAPDIPVRAAGVEQQFQYAVQQFKAGRYSAAYGRFAALANDGDPDAAHIALFMHKYGPTLYGAWWDADPTDVALWSTSIRDHRGRPQPVFIPDPYAVTATKKAEMAKSASPAGPRSAVARP